jgi:hypothetical protein
MNFLETAFQLYFLRRLDVAWSVYLLLSAWILNMIIIYQENLRLSVITGVFILLSHAHFRLFTILILNFEKLFR